jgi:predicted AlkP superfamily phosphohydrolase/phosphomutase
MGGHSEVSENNGQRVLAIGIDSAESNLVRRMIDQGEMPILKTLLADGQWIQLESPTSIGTSSVWPTFLTGKAAERHGVYSEWCWEPSTMNLRRANGHDLEPFWKQIAERGKQIGILAVPFMPLIGLTEGFEIAESYPYLSPESETRFSPHLPEGISIRAARAALSHGRINVAGPEDHKNLQRLAADSLKGLELRADLAGRLLKETKPDLSIIVFTEAHESGHCLWQQVSPEHEVFKRNNLQLNNIKPTLRDIYQEVDRQIGKLIEAVGDGATVLVFSLHGIEPALGVPTFLTSLMCDWGFARLADTTKLSWIDRAVGLTRAVKRRIPNSLKRLSYKAVSRAALVRWALPTMLPQYDWSQTRAFSLVEEQHGAIRINLIGREARGIVPLDEYDETCQQVEKALRALRTEDGKLLARQVIRTAESPERALKQRVPDLLVPWEIEAFRSPLRIQGSAGEFFPQGRRYLGQHTASGFCILRGNANLAVENCLPIKDMGQLITRLMRFQGF